MKFAESEDGAQPQILGLDFEPSVSPLGTLFPVQCKDLGNKEYLMVFSVN